MQSMLKIYIQGIDKIPSDKKIIVDTDFEFSQILNVPLDSRLQKIIQIVDGAELRSDNKIVDRFGETLPVSCISSGSKAAVVILMNPDCIVDLKECGSNARDAILTYLDTGSIIMEDPVLNAKIAYRENKLIDVWNDGYWFGNLSKFSEYIQDIKPSDPCLDRFCREVDEHA